MSFNEFLFLGFGLLPQTSIVFPSGTVAGVWNVAAYQDAKAFGGYEPNAEATFVCKSSLVPNAKALIGATVAKDGESWRVLRVRAGAAFTTFVLIDRDKV